MGGLCALVTQVGYREATICITENKLSTDPSGSIAGDLFCKCRLPDAENWNPFVCRIENSNKIHLLKLPENKNWRVSYRDWPPFPFLPREDPYAMFIYLKLGFGADEVIGQLGFQDYSVVLIRQRPFE